MRLLLSNSRRPPSGSLLGSPQSWLLHYTPYTTLLLATLLLATLPCCPKDWLPPPVEPSRPAPLAPPACRPPLPTPRTPLRLGSRARPQADTNGRLEACNVTGPDGCEVLGFVRKVRSIV